MVNDPIFNALFGGLNLNTADFVSRILKLLKSKDFAERAGAVTDLLDRSEDDEVDNELLRILGEGIKNNIPEEELDTIIYCLKTRTIRCNNVPNFGLNTTIGKKIRDMSLPLIDAYEDKHRYLILKMISAANQRCGLVEDAKMMEEMAKEIKEQRK